jgi:phosphoserine phosphatase RsbU/P
VTSGPPAAKAPRPAKPRPAKPRPAQPSPVQPSPAKASQTAQRAKGRAVGGPEAAGLRSRGAELRLAAAMPGANLKPILDAALDEVDAAADALSQQRGSGGAARTAAAHLERRLLHAVFQQLPMPVFLLGEDRTIRRANAAAAALLGSGPGYVTGKQFTALVDMPDRAQVQTQLAHAFRSGDMQRVSCGLLGADGLVDAELSMCLAGLRADSDQLIVAVGGGAVSGDAQLAGEPARSHGPADLEVVKQLTRQLDLAAEVTRLLLQDISVSESAIVQRCARLLVGRLAPWVIVDVERRDRLRRQFVAGPADPEAEDLVATVAGISPAPGTLPCQVHESTGSQLMTHVEDPDALGLADDGMPVLMLLRATSVLSVPLAEGGRCFGALTLLRQASHGRFSMADAAIAEAIGEQLALAIKASRSFRRHSAVAETLQASLRPRELMPVPGTEIAAVHVAAADGPDAGGDFYDVYQSPDGFGLAIGDVCGPARNAAAVTSAARYAIRTIAHAKRDPEHILRAANDVLLTEGLSGEFITAHAAHLRWDGGKLVVVIGSAGQPAPALITGDGQVRQLRGGGQPLGIFPDARPATQQLELSPGDALFFYSDGLADARSLELGYFADRLADELSAVAGSTAAQITAELRRRVLEFCDGVVRDDMTMLVLRVTEPPDS